ncbi:MAG: DUF2892 domain-containing protein [Actinobacteria bacterium]|jgi:hypothetical protein|nr:DUF2892 domain-containing protein [Acidimicrobiaceae bacterium]MBP9052702.1 DUF2892 domain-containing protein [Ilumatobacteraceae bacterium]NMD23326.1 DUF2892 domain-containing protein [Actinomycetota bacterium]MBK9972654.1 DUF2892 domain-containing protein [Acidimicrobiaceae bacterium]HAN36330.1 DUF2892 domain-containing protein [Acidimicrobiaceae bacterium]
MSFARFMAGPVGRGVRVAAGLAMIIAGIAIGSTGGWILAVVGVLPLLAGALNVCALAPILKAPFSGKAALNSK